MWEKLLEIDRDTFSWIHHSWIGEFESFWVFVTRIQNWFLLYILFFYLLFKRVKKPLNYIAMTAISVVVSVTLLITNLVKNQVERLRPNSDPVLMDSIQIVWRPENFSFWSGHSAVSFAVTSFVVLVLRSTGMTRWILLMYIWPVTFAFSRIFVGVHYPADVCVGMLVGLLLGGWCYLLFSKIEIRLQHTA
jgi:undecaprenyl-diphosphatase